MMNRGVFTISDFVPEVTGGLTVAAVTATTVGVANLAFRVFLKRSEEYDQSRRKQVDVAMKKLSQPFEPKRKLEGDYIARPDAEESIAQYLSGAAHYGYLVINSPKGVGKSTVLQRAIAKLCSDGVILVKIESESSDPKILKLVLKALGVSDGDPVGGDPLGFLEEVCARFAEANDGRRPVIIINIEGNRSNNFVDHSVAALARQLGHFQKAISCDSDSAHTFSDISALAVAACMDFDPRAEFVNIPNLTVEEALSFLEPYAVNLFKHGVRVGDVVANIGGNPAWLIRVGTNSDPQSFINNIMNKAGAQVAACLCDHPEYEDALRQLVGNESGMLERDFYKLVTNSNPKQPVDITVFSQKYRVIHKNNQSERIVFHTVAHERALVQELDIPRPV